MNSTATDEQAPSVEGPGKRLKALRESQELDLARVATLLHLSEEKLEALEADDYSRLPGPVFVQGYLRNYARFLGVPTEPILTAYHRLQPESGHLPDLKIAQVSHEVGSSHVVIRLITWLLVIGLLALVVVWWRGYLQWPGQSSQQLSEGAGVVGDQAAESGEEAFSPDAIPLAEISDEGPSTLVIPQAAVESDIPSEPVNSAIPSSDAPAPAVTGTVQENDAAASLPVADPADAQPAPLPAPVEERVLAPIAQQSSDVVASGSERVVVRFDGTSWTKISDASGRFNIMGEIKAGTTQPLQGTPPFNLVLGKAAVVRVFVDGREIDITPYTRGNVVRMTLDPDKINP